MANGYAFVTVDVFTTVAFEGNPLAVFPDARGLDTPTMQKIAGELNLSETTFVFPPDDPAHTAKVRIFTPRSELPFAGHPTVGTAAVLRGGSNVTRVILEETVGPIPVRVAHADDGAAQFWLTTPPITFEGTIDEAPVAAALGLAPRDLLAGVRPEVAGAGPRFLFVALSDAAAVDRVESFDHRALRAAVPGAPTEIFIFAPRPDVAGSTFAVYSRMFAPEIGIREDPATGSATCPLAAFMLRHGLLPRRDGLRMVSEQGTKMGRRSLLHVLVHIADAGEPVIEVGGSVVPIATGTLTLPT